MTEEKQKRNRRETEEKIKTTWEVLEVYDNGVIFQEAHNRILKLAQEQVKEAWEYRAKQGFKENKVEFWKRVLPIKYQGVISEYFNLGCFGERAGEIPKDNKDYENK